MTLLESTQLNLESVSQTYRAQAVLIKELRAEMEQLEAANAKLTTQLSYTNSMMDTYRQSYNSEKATSQRLRNELEK